MIPISNPRSATESSSLVSGRESFAPAQNWKSIADLAGRAKSLGDTAGVLSSKVSAPVATYSADLGFHPFKVYTIPVSYREIFQPEFDLSKNWRTVRVRGGLVFTSVDPTGFWSSLQSGIVQEVGLFGGSDTIGIWENPLPSECNATLPFEIETMAALPPTDFEFPEGETENYVWAELVEYNTIQDVDHYQVAIKAGSYGNLWEGSSVTSPNAFPRRNPYVWPLAKVDTTTWPLTYDSEFTNYRAGGIRNFAIIRQLWFDHININIPQDFWGDWTSSFGSMVGRKYLPTAGYPLNALVRRTRGLRIATYISRTWFNTETPGSGTKWEIIGEYTP